MQGTRCIAAQSEAGVISCGAGRGNMFATNWGNAGYGCDGTQPHVAFSVRSSRPATWIEACSWLVDQ